MTATDGPGGDATGDRFHDVWETRVRFAETDAQERVFYGEFVTYQDETFTSYLREIGYTWADIERADWDVHVVHVDVDYRAPARFGDELVCGLRVEAVGDSSVSFAWRCRRGDTVLAEGGLTHVTVRDGEPCRVPDDLRAAIRAHRPAPPDGG